MKISATIITYNEALNIKECIQSLIPVVDEIIVVDSLSTDNTALICQEFSEVKFITNAFEGHVQQKNFAMLQTTHELVLSLDADERLSQSLQTEILALKLKAVERDVAYSMPRLNNHYGYWIKHSGVYPDRKIRLWNKNKGKWGGNNPHDKVIVQAGVEIKQLKSDILHFTTASISTHLAQVNKFSEIAAADLIKANKKPNAYFKMLFDPPFLFIKKYFFQLGFLDGFPGFVIAIISAHAKFLKYAKYIQMRSKNDAL